MSEPSFSVQLQRAVRKLVATGSNLDPSCVIPGQDNAPFPDLPCATVTPIADIPEGSVWTRETRVGYREYPDSDMTAGPTIDSQAFRSAEVSYSVQWFGEAAEHMARTFATWAGSSAGATEIARRGLTFYRTGAVRDLSAGEREHWEQRSGLDLFLGVVFTDTRDVGLIESADVDIFYDRLAGESLADNHATVSIPSPQKEAGND